MKIGNTDYNLEAIKGMNKKEFVKTFKGKINTDIDETFETLKKSARRLKKGE